MAKCATKTAIVIDSGAMIRISTAVGIFQAQVNMNMNMNRNMPVAVFLCYLVCNHQRNPNENDKDHLVELLKFVGEFF